MDFEPVVSFARNNILQTFEARTQQARDDLVRRKRFKRKKAVLFCSQWILSRAVYIKFILTYIHCTELNMNFTLIGQWKHFVVFACG